MKTFCLIRHAKSDRDPIYESDFVRPLKKRGRRDAQIMAKVLLEEGIVFDLHLYSPAQRALETENIFHAEMDNVDLNRRSSDALYLPAKETIWREVRALNESVTAPVIFSHNFGVEDFVHQFNSGIEVPTCFIGFFSSSASNWKDISEKNTNIIHYLYPKMYR